ncbi:DeoR/GlpR family DNA-binding transcription regulator [Psychrobacillus lasiicapitis]|uniref:DeoR/GlpR transcriptional regulator n=1 Tax=Psychrobacillus lasiicapitis TaxID=1636719 RepID=A0A544T1K4_9BACI|nr:DeoR/GlpR family DNA-binding transcription regulator [Psychrobacillus lasiicapitis]TQR11335.1 DeoR/GlpR transcriptional regulator [Psychrobacillus lasiicapitis]GGA41389.1 putative HTH-type transcriptional regulator [Psychrobacillus lasiicapitis]
MTFSKLERFEHILSKLEFERKIVVSVIAEELNVAPETIRRDFDELEEQHLLTRVHGGAVKFINLRKEPEYLRKINMQKEAKREIARVAATRIKDGDTIAVDVGTTTVHIADFLVEVNNVTVVTNSISAAVRFNMALEEKRMTGKVILLGGTTNPEQSSVSGAMTLEWLSRMNLDKAFLSCGGIDDGIVYDYDLDESLVSAKMLENSYYRILLADTTKINQKSFYTICNLHEISEVICEEARPSTWTAFEGKWTVANGGKCK